MKQLLTHQRNKFLTKLAFLILISSMSVAQVSAQEIEKKISEIRKIYTQTNTEIAKAEADFQESSIFMTELIVNKGGTSYPAVGTYKKTVRFYYTYGDREADPYPNKLLKIAVTTKSAAREMKSEFLFDTQDNLIFYFSKDSDAENRLYFSNGKLVRLQIGKQLQKTDDAAAKELVKEAAYQKDRFVKIFRNSL